MGSNEKKPRFVPLPKLGKKGIDKIVAVMSGKGGVGKSFIACMLAIELRRAGYEVGILDADLTGPSVPKMLGLKSRPTVMEGKVMPVLSKSGIKAMSMNLLLENPEKPIIWRGPLISKAIRELYGEVDWGKLDFLIVDLPPGTSDAPLTVFQSLPVDGVVTVMTPQDVARLIVAKAMNMAKTMNVPIIGIVENMSFFKCPKCGEVSWPFGPSREEEIKALGVEFLGSIPIDPEISRLSDLGRLEDYEHPALEEMGKRFLKSLSGKVGPEK